MPVLRGTINLLMTKAYTPKLGSDSLKICLAYKSTVKNKHPTTAVEGFWVKTSAPKPEPDTDTGVVPPYNEYVNNYEVVAAIITNWESKEWKIVY